MPKVSRESKTRITWVSTVDAVGALNNGKQWFVKAVFALLTVDPVGADGQLDLTVDNCDVRHLLEDLCEDWVRIG